MEGIRVSGQGSGSESFWRIAFLAAIGSLGALPQAEAAIYYWQDSGPGFTQSTPIVPPRQLKTRRHRDTKAVVSENESAKPQGPLIISISLAEQKLRLYDVNGLFAESPVSTGMPGHPTPMGVFSIIQKQKFHRSNIYSGAPMPFMQRITWSGVALHAGVVPGHPASHGCIRMPAAFAVKMWNWTKMGARVVITPHSVSPAPFSHPMLATLKVLPQPVTAKVPESDTAAKGSEDAPKNQANAAPALHEPEAGSRSTIGHEDRAKQIAEALDARAAPPTQTADASGALAESASMSDAAPAGQAMPAVPPAADLAVSDKQVSSPPAALADFSRAGAEPSVAKKVETAPPGDRAANDASANSEPNPAPNGELKSAEADLATRSNGPPTPIEAQAPKTTSERSAEKPADPVAPAMAIPTSTGNQPAGDVRPRPAAKPDPTSLIKRSGQIAIFVSRKDSKLYVRQNFSPLF